MPESNSYDIVICGGGLVGASLALMFARLETDVALIEAVPFGATEQPSFDERTTALSNGSRRIFEALGIWSLIDRDATPIRSIHVSDRGRFGFARIEAREQGLTALGFVVPNRIMGAALWRRLQAEPRIELIAPARIVGLGAVDDARSVALSLAEAGRRSIRGHLIVAADGARSVVREAAGIGSTVWEYEQTAIVTNVATQRFHHHVAYERFTPGGPLALLPIADGRCGVVWTLEPERARQALELDDTRFLAALQDAFGFRLGRLLKVGRRQSYPLALTRSEAHVADRLAVVGNAAQSLHPIAGQGLNLGLRDAASLAEVAADAMRSRPGAFDAGDHELLSAYRAWRAEDRRRIVGFTDGLVRLFSQPFLPAKILRSLALLAFDLSPGAKDALSRLSLGAAGRVPRLARGAPL